MSMKSSSGMTVIETVVIVCIASLLLLIGIPKILEGITKSKMKEGMDTFYVFEAAQLAYFAQNHHTGPIDSLVFTAKMDTSEYFTFRNDGLGSYTAQAKKPIGRFRKGSWIHTRVEVVGGFPQILRSCSTGDSSFVRQYVPGFFQ
jgi:Tfp pilus assembly protein PilE